jgi:cation diffusion facilitator CzcD-associated flavoprotein CzcO
MHHDAIIVGAGFAGLYMLHRLRGLGFSARIYEAGSGVGGTWFWNRYPGARCDVESLEYSYSFSEELDREWKWSERYSTQTEILRYLNHVADRFQLRDDIVLDTRVTSAVFDESSNLWKIHTDRHPPVTARFCIMATGCLSAAKLPEYPGLDSFRGKSYHTGHWPHEGVDFSGQKVGVIGTGSSAIQSTPSLPSRQHTFMCSSGRPTSVFRRTISRSPRKSSKIGMSTASLTSIKPVVPVLASSVWNRITFLPSKPLQRNASAPSSSAGSAEASPC